MKYALHPDTLLLTSDLRWIRAETVDANDGIISLQKEPSKQGAHRRWVETPILSVGKGEAACAKITFDDEETVIAASSMSWIVRRGRNVSISRTGQLRARGRNSSHVCRPLTPWKFEADRGAGYLAAAFDGEGHITQRVGGADQAKKGNVAQTSIGFAQKRNAMLREVERELERLGFEFCRHKPDKRGVVRLSINQRPTLLRFLGSVRPLRLLAKFDAQKLGAVTDIRSSARKVLSNELIGLRFVVTLQVESEAILANGFACCGT